MVGREGFEPSKASPTDLQSLRASAEPYDRKGLMGDEENTVAHTVPAPYTKAHKDDPLLREVLDAWDSLSDAKRRMIRDLLAL